MTMRIVHRWLVLIFGILIAYWAVTGISLAAIDILDSQKAWAGDGGGPGAPAPVIVGGIEVAHAGTLTLDDVRRVTAITLQAARTRVPSAPVSTLEITADRHVLRGAVRFADPSLQSITVNAASGEIVETAAAERPAGNGPAQSLHGTIKNIHRGTLPGLRVASLGTLGSWLGLTTGVVLVLLALTGGYVYVAIWSARRRVRRPQFFWRDASVWRTWHRWVSAFALAFLLNQAITGALLSWFNLSDASQARDGATPGYTDGELTSTVESVWQRVQQAAPGAPIMALILTHNGSEPFAPVFIGGAHPGAIGFRLRENDYIFGASGAVGPGGAPADSHSWMKRIHRGDFIGSFSGRYLSLAAGLAMLWLLVSGLIVYVGARKR